MYVAHIQFFFIASIDCIVHVHVYLRSTVIKNTGGLGTRLHTHWEPGNEATHTVPCAELAELRHNQETV